MHAAGSFLQGFLSLTQGFALVRTAPKARATLWQTFGAFVIVILLSQLWFGSAVYLGLGDLRAQLSARMPPLAGLGDFVAALATMVVVFLAWAANLVLTWALLRLLLSFLLSLLAERILKHLGRATPGAERLWATFATGLKRGLLLLVISMPFAVALLIPGLNLLAAGVFALILAADQLDFAMEALGWSLRERVAFLRRHLAAWLGLTAQLLCLSLIPFVGLLLLPLTVAGATVLVHRLAQADSESCSRHLTNSSTDRL